MANTYSIMQARIADELDRPDLTSQIQNAIQDAIGFYERRYFYFMNAPVAASFNTVAHQEYYASSDQALLATLPILSTLTGTFYGLRRRLNKRDWDYINSISALSTSYAQPVDWAYFGEQIRLYPIPDNVYALTVAGVARPTRPSAGPDTGVWMNDAEALIRTNAKIRLIDNVIRGTDMVEERGLLAGQEAAELAALTGETATRESTGRIAAAAF